MGHCALIMGHLVSQEQNDFYHEIWEMDAYSMCRKHNILCILIS